MNAYARDPGLVLADAWQRDFPLVPQPFVEVGASRGLTEREAIATFRRLKARGLLSRIGPVVRANAAGASTLAAMAVPPAQLDAVAAVVSAHPFVNHNYARAHAINLWFVVTAPDAEKLADVLAEIAAAAGFDVLDLRLLEPYHIDLGFGLRDGRKQAAGAAKVRKADAREKLLLETLQDGLDLTPRPYEKAAGRLGWPEDEVIATLATLSGDRVLSRFGCVLHHREVGFTANAMAVWDIPDEMVDAYGRRVADNPHVTLCYRRNRVQPQWPYNLFAMIHGRAEPVVRETIAHLNADLGLSGFSHDVLFSTRCYLQRGARIGASRRAA